MIKMEPQFGGAPCPETVQRKKCRIRKCLRNPNIEKRRWKEPREKRRTEQTKEDVDGEQFPGMCRAGCLEQFEGETGMCSRRLFYFIVFSQASDRSLN